MAAVEICTLAHTPQRIIKDSSFQGVGAGLADQYERAVQASPTLRGAAKGD
jgi:hypothetical protein